MIKITTKRKILRVDLPARLKADLETIFSQDGGITALEDASGVHRNTIRPIKKDWKASKAVADKLRNGISILKAA